jgi:hypothetical protein
MVPAIIDTGICGGSIGSSGIVHEHVVAQAGFFPGYYKIARVGAGRGYGSRSGDEMWVLSAGHCG